VFFLLIVAPFLYLLGRILMAAPLAPPPRLGGKLGHLEARRSDVNRVNDFLIRPNRVSGFYEIFFTGTATTQEVALDVVFPVWFVDRPAMSFGGELLRDIVEAGSFPTISVVVTSWTKTYDVRPGGGYYTGCTFAVVVSGREGEEMIVHWQADGKALHLTGGGGGGDA
jgi:hypothetical protein